MSPTPPSHANNGRCIACQTPQPVSAKPEKQRHTYRTATAKSTQKEKAMTASRKVLVVDDDPAVRKSIDRVLSGKGYAVITAETGEEALRKLNEEKYDLV